MEKQGFLEKISKTVEKYFSELYIQQVAENTNSVEAAIDYIENDVKDEMMYSINSKKETDCLNKIQETLEKYRRKVKNGV